MNARELRIGNTISARYHKNDCATPYFFWMPIQVGSIYKDYIVTDVGERIELIDKFLKPESLTEDWLVKLQYVYQGDSQLESGHSFKIYWHPAEVMIGVDDEGAFFLVCSKRSESQNLDFVHVLQNLHHSLTGAELTI